MKMVFERCAGIDVHKRSLVVCCLTPDERGTLQKEVTSWSSLTPEVLRLRDHLIVLGITHVVMEASGVSWKPISNLLEDAFTVWVVNAHHVKAVPGRKTDIRDAEWLADLLRHGLLRPSFVPSPPERELRDVTRSRASLVQERSRTIQRLHKVLEDATIKLASVASDLMGRSAQSMLAALLEGQHDPALLADLAKGRLRAKRDLLEQALTGHLRPHHCFLVSEQLMLIDTLDESIARFSQEIDARLRPFASQIAHLMTIPGVGRRSAEVIIAEIGFDIHRFPNARHLASWAGMCPGNRQSAGKALKAPTRKGSPWLRSALVEVAHAAARSKNTSLATHYRRLASRRGANRAAVAVGHTILVIIFHLLTTDQEYRDLGRTYLDQRNCQTVQRRLVQRLTALGYEISLIPIEPPVSP